jgi:IclR family pca regulon transcriptional regulator
LVDQELEIGLMSISVPLRTSAGVLVGAINVGVPTLRMSTKEILAEILPKLQLTASNISKALKGLGSEAE